MIHRGDKQIKSRNKRLGDFKKREKIEATGVEIFLLLIPRMSQAPKTLNPT